MHYAEEISFCKEKDGILDPDGIWASRFSLGSSKRRRIFVHFFCALYSPRTWFTGDAWCNLKKEVYRSSGLACKSCNKKGASLGCIVHNCNYVAHIPCALREGLNASSFACTQSFLCREHIIQRRNEELRLDAKVKADITKGRETIQIAVKNNVDETVFPGGFEYITSNVDSDNVVASVQNVEKIPCCSCDGLCNDVNVCACLQAYAQRNYTSHGALIPGADKPIIECNMRCNCSIRRCTNRVVEQGIRFPLQIFRRRPPLKSGETALVNGNASSDAATGSGAGSSTASTTAAPGTATPGKKGVLSPENDRTTKVKLFTALNFVVSLGILRYCGSILRYAFSSTVGWFIRRCHVICLLNSKIYILFSTVSIVGMGCPYTRGHSHRSLRLRNGGSVRTGLIRCRTVFTLR
jgi:hypothetical protein